MSLTLILFVAGHVSGARSRGTFMGNVMVSKSDYTIVTIVLVVYCIVQVNAVRAILLAFRVNQVTR